MTHKLEVQNLQISFRTQNGKVQAVRNISFHLDQGETLCIVGESGSGKSVTSKAIIGILAGNSIVEGGKIIYDGMDLLKIDTEDMHNIRGDKISMIFQDPMSSLNPIKRVGIQITEAMLFKNKSRIKSARRNFNSKLSLLKHYLDLAYPEEQEKNDADCKAFDSFCVLNTKLEREFNHANSAAIEALTEINDLLFLMDKNQKIEYKKRISKILKLTNKSLHQFVLIKTEELDAILQALSSIKSVSDENKDKVCTELGKLKVIVEDSLSKEKPNYFRIAYCMYKDPAFSLDMPIHDLNTLCRQRLDYEFMNEFLDRVSHAYQFEFKECLEKKKDILPLLKSIIQYIEEEELDYKKLVEFYSSITPKVEDAKNKLAVTKNSVEYTFASAYMGLVQRYFNGVKTNPKNQKEHDKMQEKYDSLKAKGKEPSWKVTPAYVTDLELQKNNLLDVCKQLYESYTKEIDNQESYDSLASAVQLIDYFKEQASLLVNYITRGMAKAKAIQLLKEVGIPEPELRYKQYPFEFSGGMRQRIVIAIALAADPEILICDEPTTALDVTIQSQILELINKIKEERKLSVIFITHNLGVVANTADRVAVMYAGKIVEYGTVREVFYDPRHPYTWALLSSMPDLDTKTELEAITGTPPNMIYPPKGDAFAERNKYALEIDFELEPPLFEITPTHYAATWLLHPNAPKVDIPAGIIERIERMKKRMEHDEQ